MVLLPVTIGDGHDGDGRDERDGRNNGDDGNMKFLARRQEDAPPTERFLRRAYVRGKPELVYLYRWQERKGC